MVPLKYSPLLLLGLALQAFASPVVYLQANQHLYSLTDTGDGAFPLIDLGDKKHNGGGGFVGPAHYGDRFFYIDRSSGSKYKIRMRKADTVEAEEPVLYESSPGYSPYVLGKSMGTMYGVQGYAPWGKYYFGGEQYGKALYSIDVPSDWGASDSPMLTATKMNYNLAANTIGHIHFLSTEPNAGIYQSEAGDFYKLTFDTEAGTVSSEVKIINKMSGWKSGNWIYIEDANDPRFVIATLTGIVELRLSDCDEEGTCQTSEFESWPTVEKYHGIAHNPLENELYITAQLIYGVDNLVLIRTPDTKGNYKDRMMIELDIGALSLDDTARGIVCFPGTKTRSTRVVTPNRGTPKPGVYHQYGSSPIYLNRVNLDLSGDEQLMEFPGMFWGPAIDVENGYMYFIDHTDGGTIFRQAYEKEGPPAPEVVWSCANRPTVCRIFNAFTFGNTIGYDPFNKALYFVAKIKDDFALYVWKTEGAQFAPEIVYTGYIGSDWQGGAMRFRDNGDIWMANPFQGVWAMESPLDPSKRNFSVVIPNNDSPKYRGAQIYGYAYEPTKDWHLTCDDKGKVLAYSDLSNLMYVRELVDVTLRGVFDLKTTYYCYGLDYDPDTGFLWITYRDGSGPNYLMLYHLPTNTAIEDPEYFGTGPIPGTKYSNSHSKHMQVVKGAFTLPNFTQPETVDYTWAPTLSLAPTFAPSPNTKTNSQVVYQIGGVAHSIPIDYHPTSEATKMFTHDIYMWGPIISKNAEMYEESDPRYRAPGEIVWADVNNHTMYKQAAADAEPEIVYQCENESGCPIDSNVGPAGQSGAIGFSGASILFTNRANKMYEIDAEGSLTEYTIAVPSKIGSGATVRGEIAFGNGLFVMATNTGILMLTRSEDGFSAMGKYPSVGTNIWSVDVTTFGIIAPGQEVERYLYFVLENEGVWRTNLTNTQMNGEDELVERDPDVNQYHGVAINHLTEEIYITCSGSYTRTNNWLVRRSMHPGNEKERLLVNSYYQWTSNDAANKQQLWLSVQWGTYERGDYISPVFGIDWKRPGNEKPGFWSLEFGMFGWAIKRSDPALTENEFVTQGYMSDVTELVAGPVVDSDRGLCYYIYQMSIWAIPYEVEKEFAVPMKIFDTFGHNANRMLSQFYSKGRSVGWDGKTMYFAGKTGMYGSEKMVIWAFEPGTDTVPYQLYVVDDELKGFGNNYEASNFIFDSFGDIWLANRYEGVWKLTNPHKDESRVERSWDLVAYNQDGQSYTMCLDEARGHMYTSETTGKVFKWDIGTIDGTVKIFKSGPARVLIDLSERGNVVVFVPRQGLMLASFMALGLQYDHESDFLYLSFRDGAGTQAQLKVHAGTQAIVGEDLNVGLFGNDLSRHVQVVSTGTALADVPTPPPHSWAPTPAAVPTRNPTPLTSANSHVYYQMNGQIWRVPIDFNPSTEPEWIASPGLNKASFSGPVVRDNWIYYMDQREWSYSEGVAKLVRQDISDLSKVEVIDAEVKSGSASKGALGFNSNGDLIYSDSDNQLLKRVYDAGTDSFSFDSAVSWTAGTTGIIQSHGNTWYYQDGTGIHAVGEAGTAEMILDKDNYNTLFGFDFDTDGNLFFACNEGLLMKDLETEVITKVENRPGDSYFGVAIDKTNNWLYTKTYYSRSFYGSKLARRSTTPMDFENRVDIVDTDSSTGSNSIYQMWVSVADGPSWSIPDTSVDFTVDGGKDRYGMRFLETTIDYAWYDRLSADFCNKERMPTQRFSEGIYQISPLVDPELGFEITIKGPNNIVYIPYQENEYREVIAFSCIKKNIVNQDVEIPGCEWDYTGQVFSKGLSVGYDRVNHIFYYTTNRGSTVYFWKWKPGVTYVPSLVYTAEEVIVASSQGGSANWQGGKLFVATGGDIWACDGFDHFYKLANPDSNGDQTLTKYACPGTGEHCYSIVYSDDNAKFYLASAQAGSEKGWVWSSDLPDGPWEQFHQISFPEGGPTQTVAYPLGLYIESGNYGNDLIIGFRDGGGMMYGYVLNVQTMESSAQKVLYGSHATSRLKVFDFVFPPATEPSTLSNNTCSGLENIGNAACDLNSIQDTFEDLGIENKTIDLCNEYFGAKLMGQDGLAEKACKCYGAIKARGDWVNGDMQDMFDCYMLESDTDATETPLFDACEASPPIYEKIAYVDGDCNNPDRAYIYTASGCETAIQYLNLKMATYSFEKDSQYATKGCYVQGTSSTASVYFNKNNNTDKKSGYNTICMVTPGPQSTTTTTTTATDLCASVTCSPLDQCHTKGECDSATGMCSNPVAVDAVCDDENANTIDDKCTSDGTCAGTDLCAGVTCEASDQCHVVGTCNHQTGQCSDPIAPNNQGCDDEDPTTVDDHCVAGICKGYDAQSQVCSESAFECASGTLTVDGARCATNTCNADDFKVTGHCCNTDLCFGKTCEASSQCHTEGVCDSATGECSNPLAADGTQCDDDNDATVDDKCTAGQCAGTDLCAAVQCAALSACHLPGECDSATGECSVVTAAKDTSCVAGKCDGSGICVISTASAPAKTTTKKAATEAATTTTDTTNTTTTTKAKQQVSGGPPVSISCFVVILFATLA